MINVDNLPIEITYVSETVNENWGNHTVDQWRVSLKNRNGKYESIDYFTGLGHRKQIKNTPPFPSNISKRSVAYKKWHYQYIRPVKPDVLTVLRSLILDCDMAGDNFNNFCGYFGLSNDSIKALDTYRACMENREIMFRVFTRQEYEELKTLTEDK